jgi:hypothetical protein
MANADRDGGPAEWGTGMDGVAHVTNRRPSRIQRSVVWFRDNIVTGVVVGIVVPAGVAWLGISALAPSVGEGVQVANVYNLPRDRALRYITDQGFTKVRVNLVCSNSVGAGYVREVLLDDGSSTADETVFVGPLGSKPVKVPLSTELLVKVSNGRAC